MQYVSEPSRFRTWQPLSSAVPAPAGRGELLRAPLRLREQGVLLWRPSKGVLSPRRLASYRRKIMAAAVPQPVMVGSPIGAPTADCPIYLDANSPVVLATPCLNWQPAPAGPGGQARMQLMTFQAVSAFLPPCSISRTAVDQARRQCSDSPAHGRRLVSYPYRAPCRSSFCPDGQLAR